MSNQTEKQRCDCQPCQGTGMGGFYPKDACVHCRGKGWKDLEAENAKLADLVRTAHTLATCQYWEPQDDVTLRGLEALRKRIEEETK